MPDSPTAFLELKALATTGGASAAVTVIANTVQYLLKRSSSWIPFVASVAIVLIVDLANQKLKVPSGWLLAFINSCLLFCTASGINGLAVHLRTAAPTPATDVLHKEAAAPRSGPITRFFQPWLRSA